jgi:hypothetical protein
VNMRKVKLIKPARRALRKQHHASFFLVSYGRKNSHSICASMVSCCGVFRPLLMIDDSDMKL